MSSLSKVEAYAALELPNGADADAIRTSYKRLTQKWHPDKHQKSVDSWKMFNKISVAYKKLSADNAKDSLTKDEMLQLYQQIMYPRCRNTAVMDDVYSSSDEDSDSSEEDRLTQAELLNRLSKGSTKVQYRHDDDSDNEDDDLTPEQREQFANELISEEEKRKRQLEKRRAKKKQRREKKRLEKQTIEAPKKEEPKMKVKVKEELKVATNTKATNKKRDKKTENSNSTKLEAEEFDPSAAFYKQVSKKSKPVAAEGHPVEKLKSAECRQTLTKNEEPGPDVNPVTVESRQLAIRGNTMASAGQYENAIDLFTKAIQLDASDYRFFGNRSYCYERLEQYDKALKDASKAINQNHEWPKGYFRKGRALAGLKNYAGAEDSFVQVLKLDKNCDDAKVELKKVRTFQLMEMGFSPNQAQSAITQFETVQLALDSLLSGLVAENPSLTDVYISDDDEPQAVTKTVTNNFHTSTNNSTHVSNTVTTTANKVANGTSYKAGNKKAPLPPIPQHHYEHARQIQQNNKHLISAVDDFKMNPCNPEGLTSLWVGNVLPEVDKETLQQMFTKFGALQGVRCLPEKYCAFVNFVSKECAGRAMQALQGADCAGQKLLIKFPDNPVTAASSNNNAMEKFKSQESKLVEFNQLPPMSHAPKIESNHVQPKRSPPVEVQQSIPQPKKMPLFSLPASEADSSASASSSSTGGKMTGPVNGDECYFWRTTGCQFAASCRYLHLPEHKGIDKKPWHKAK